MHWCLTSTLTLFFLCSSADFLSMNLVIEISEIVKWHQKSLDHQCVFPNIECQWCSGWQVNSEKGQSHGGGGSKGGGVAREEDATQAGQGLGKV